MRLKCIILCIIHPATSHLETHIHWLSWKEDSYLKTSDLIWLSLLWMSLAAGEMELFLIRSSEIYCQLSQQLWMLQACCLIEKLLLPLSSFLGIWHYMTRERTSKFSLHAHIVTISVQLPFALPSKLNILWNVSTFVLVPFLHLFSSSFSWLSSCNMSHILPNRTNPKHDLAFLFFSRQASSKSVHKIPLGHNSEGSFHTGDGYVNDKKEYKSHSNVKINK